MLGRAGYKLDNTYFWHVHFSPPLRGRLKWREIASPTVEFSVFLHGEVTE